MKAKKSSNDDVKSFYISKTREVLLAGQTQETWKLGWIL